MPQREQDAGLIRFGVFEFDLAAHELRKNGRRVRLREQPFQILRLLLANPGEVVTREELQHEIWKDDTFVDFDNSLNAAVANLREALGDSASNPRFILTVPRQGYRFVAPVGRDEAIPPEPSPSRPWGRVVAVTSVVVVALVYYLWPRSAPEPLAFTERALTYTEGWEQHPSLSPDGTRVAYHWPKTDQGVSDIYVKHLEPGSGEPVRVTSDPRNDISPAWSPDGTKIVFARFLDHRLPPQLTRFRLVLVFPVRNSREQVLGEFSTRSWQALPSWSPDGRHIAFSCHMEAPTGLRQVCIYSLETGETWPITSPSGDVGDGHAVFRPDGRAIVYQDGDKGLRLLELSEELRPEGGPRTLSGEFSYPDPAGWSPDGKLIYFMAHSLKGESGLWSISPSGSAAAELIRSVNPNGLPNPSLGWSPRGRMRVVYEERNRDSEIVRVDLTGKHRGKLTPLTRTARPDFNPQFSPDGSRIAFMSNRTGGGTGGEAIWICNRDGSDQELLVELKPFAGFSQPSWSPDGMRIAIDAIHKTAIRDVYMVDIASKRVVGNNLTQGGGRYPAWSRDGRFLYYFPGDSPAIGKLDVRTGEKTLLLDGFGTGPFAESFESRTLYFRNGSDLMKVPLDRNRQAAGDPQKIAGPMVSFAVSRKGVYWMDSSGVVFFQEERSNKVNTVIEVPCLHEIQQSCISVSPDGEVLLYPHWKRTEVDLKLLEAIVRD